MPRPGHGRPTVRDPRHDCERRTGHAPDFAEYWAEEYWAQLCWTEVRWTEVRWTEVRWTEVRWTEECRAHHDG